MIAAASVSILTPVHNGVEFLTECVLSVISQTFTRWEMWIGVNGHGDDGGDVGTLVVALSALDSRIRVVIQPSTVVGKVAALNDLFMRSGSGCGAGWIALLDCDDVWHPEKLEKQMGAVGVGAVVGVGVGVAVVGTQCEYFGAASGSPQIPTGLISTHDLIHVNPIINSSALISRAWIERVSEAPNMWSGGGSEWKLTEGTAPLEDYELWMRIVLGGGRLFNLPECLTRHRIHPASAFNSRGHDVRPLREWFTRKLKGL